MIPEEKFKRILTTAFVSYRCPCCKSLIGPNEKWCYQHDTVSSRLKYRILSWYGWKKYKIKFWFKLHILKDPDAIRIREAQLRLSKIITRVGTSNLPRGDVIHEWAMTTPSSDVFDIHFMINKSKQGIPCQEIPLSVSPQECVLGKNTSEDTKK